MLLYRFSPEEKAYSLLPPATKLGQDNIFRRVCQEFCSWGGGWYSSMPSRWYPSMPCRSWGCVSQHALQVSRPTPRGQFEGSGLGGSPGPHPGGSWGVWPGGVSPGPHPGGGWGVWSGGSSGPHPEGSPGPQMGGSLGPYQGVSQHALRQTPPHTHSWWLLLQVVRILLECILVTIVIIRGCSCVHLTILDPNNRVFCCEPILSDLAILCRLGL